VEELLQLAQLVPGMGRDHQSRARHEPTASAGRR
jgi:hypothetical protein